MKTSDKEVGRTPIPTVNVLEIKWTTAVFCVGTILYHPSGIVKKYVLVVLNPAYHEDPTVGLYEL